MVEAEGTFLRISEGMSYAARVRVQVQFDRNGPLFLTDCAGQPTSSQGDIEEATGTGYKDWKQGAEAGVRHALRVAKKEQYCVRVTHIVGITTDTNPTIVGAAAIQAVWQAIDYTPLPAEVARLESIVFGSWQKANDFVPDFG